MFQLHPELLCLWFYLHYIFSKFVNLDSYCVVFDTIIEDMPNSLFQDRPWGKGNNPRTAVNAFLKSNQSFQVDEEIHNKLGITVAPHGFLKRIK